MCLAATEEEQNSMVVTELARRHFNVIMCEVASVAPLNNSTAVNHMSS